MVRVGPGYMPGAVECYQWEAEFEKLLAIYRFRKPKRVLEVGTYHGGTLWHWLQNAQPGTFVVSVDSYAVGVDNSRLYDSWTPEGCGYQVIRGDSRKPTVIAAAETFGHYDWIFIDAGHLYEEVKDDWENYRPMCQPGGVVVFHDILPPSRTWPDIQVAWLWKEIRQFGWTTSEIVADPDAEWGGLGIVWM